MNEAINLLAAAAEQGDSVTKLQLATVLLANKQQLRKAVTLLDTLANEGNRKARALLGFAYAELGRECYRSLPSKPNGGDALEWLEKAAKAGYKQAYYDLGMICMRNGRGLSQDMAAAENWLIAGANAGDADSTHALGKLYLSQASADPDNVRKAIYWLTNAAAAHDHSSSQRELGQIYLEGILAETDYDESAKWFAKSLSAKC